MQHVDDVGESNRAGSPVGLAIEVVNDLQHARAAESPDRTRGPIDRWRELDDAITAAMVETWPPRTA